MAVSIDVQIDRRQLRSLDRIAKSWPGKAKTIMKRSIKRTVLNARTRLTDIVSTKITVGKNKIKKRIFADTNFRSKDIGLFSGKLDVSASSLPLIEFSARQNKKGVSVKVFTNESRTLVRHAFIKKTRSGTRHVLKRAPDPSTESGLVGSIPVFIKYGPSVAGAVADELGGVTRRKEIVRRGSFLRKTQEILAKNITQQIDLLINEAARS